MKRALLVVLLAAAAVALAGCAAGAPVASHPPPVLSKTAPDSKGAHLVTRAQIEARNAGKGVTVAAVLVTYGEAHSLAPDLAGASRALVDPRRKVWLVTDYYDSPRRETRDGSLRAKMTSRHDSFVLDAATDTQLDACQGCAVVPGSNTNWPAAGRPTLTRAQVVADFRRGFDTTDVRVRLVWSQEKVTDVDLEWMAYAPHARVRLIGGPIGAPEPKPYRGSAGAVIGAMGAPPAGSWSIRPNRGRHVRPFRSRTIPVAMVKAFGKKGFRIALTPIRNRPTVGRTRVLASLGRQVSHIWLVDLFEPEQVRLTWLVALRNGSYVFVDAVSGKRVAVTR